jgi:murein DD-endopeptidase MepM/ murein hydrolase activator NlpD
VVGAHITQLFGQLPGAPWGDCAPGGHPGTDYGCPQGTPVRAASAGRVIFAGPASGFGDHAVTIFHPLDGVSSTYGHMMAHYVSDDSAVAAGQVIGLADTQGYATGPHLHFELRPGDQEFGAYPPNFDPDAWLHARGAYAASKNPGDSPMAAVPTVNTNVALNMAAPAIRTLQGLLEARGGMIKPDNVDHPVFTTNVRWFQEKAGLTVDGVVGPVTAARLLQPLNGK